MRGCRNPDRRIDWRRGLPLQDLAIGHHSYAEVAPKFVHVGGESAIWNHVDYRAVLHDVMPIRDLCGEAEILLDKQNGETARLDVRDGAVDLAHDDWRQSFSRLIEQKKPRAGSQDARDGEHLLLAAR